MKEQIKHILAELPKEAQWYTQQADISEYVGSHLDDLQHMDEDRMKEFLIQLYGTIKKIRDVVEK